MNNDPRSYLKRLGVTADSVKIGKGAAKAASASVRSHARAEPPKSTPGPNARKLGIKEAKVSVARPAEKKQRDVEAIMAKNMSSSSFAMMPLTKPPGVRGVAEVKIAKPKRLRKP